MVQIYIRTLANNRVGLGHLIRCISLIKELKQYKITFLINDNYIAKKLLDKNNLNYYIIGDKKELKQIYNLINSKNQNLLILDRYKINNNYLKKLNDVFDYFVAITPKTEFFYPVDIIINDNHKAENLSYNTRGAIKLLGSKYKLMRKEFQDLSQRKIYQNISQIMITTGGSDPLNLTPDILKVISNIIDQEVVIKVVIGPGFQYVDHILDQINKMNLQIELVYNINKMSHLMLNSDIAITAGGTTLYELAATGTPAITVLQAENQINNAEGMSEEGTVINLGLNEDLNDAALKKAIKRLMLDYELRKNMSKRGKKLIDGYGAKRCANEIINLIKNK